MGLKNAIAEVEECIKKRSTTLFLDDQRLTDKNFKAGGRLDVLLRQCTWLESLVLNSNYAGEGSDQLRNVITRLPDAIADLTNLRSLTCAGSGEERGKLINIDLVAHLTNLDRLDLSYNGLTGLVSMEGMDNLRQISLRGNKVSQVNMSGLRSLVDLDLCHNAIERISGLQLPTSLQVLDLEQNDVRKIDGLDNLPFLKELDLSYNDIEEIRGLNGSQQLTRLILGSNLIEIIEGLDDLPWLLQLDLSYNDIKQIRGLDNLLHLTILNLNGNKISEIKGLSRLSSLKEVNLSGNKLRSLESSGIKRSVSLLVAHNEITEISKDVYTDYFSSPIEVNYGSSVRYRNQARFVGSYEDETFFESLQSPLLSDNEIGEHFKDLFQTHTINLQLLPNPLVSPPVEVVRQGRDAIQNYFLELDRAGAEYLYEAKMLIVGQPRAGKTSLRRKLFDVKADLPVEDETTRGIDIQQLQFDITDREGRARKFSYNIWDFGGQQIYQTTHQFFLTRRSLYILVVDSAKDSIGSDDTTLNYWLQVVELLGGDSPLLLVKNEKNRRPVNLDLSLKRGRFGFLKGDYTVDLDGLNPDSPRYEPDNEKKFQHLKDDIVNELRHLPLVGFPMPANWVRIRERLQTLSTERPHISRQEYIHLCEEFGVTDFDRQMELSGIFHDLGVFLHFRDYSNLEDFIILQNVWATDAVFAVLDNETVSTNKGRFTDADLPLIWKAKEYKKEIHKKLLSLMMQFELCYELEKGRYSSYIVPEMLPNSPPEGHFWQEKDELVVYYNYDFMPKGLLTRLIVRLNKYIFKQEDQQIVWKTGVKIDGDTLFCPNTVALIREAWDDRELFVRVQGNFPKDLMNRITHEIDLLNADYFKQVGDGKEQKSRFRKMIPCTCPVCAENAIDDKHFYDYDKLLKAREMNSQIQCQVSFSMVGVQQLLDGVFFRDKAGRESGSPKKLFISYSKHDLRLVNEFLSHLPALLKDGKLEAWYCSAMEAGTEWNEEIRRKFEDSDIVCFMISPEFMRTDYIWQKEVKMAFEKKAGKPDFRIIPIILDYCQWKTGEYNLGRFTALPYVERPVAAFKNHNEAWYVILECLKLVIEKDLDPNGDAFYTHQALSKEVMRIYLRIIEGKVDG